MSTKADIIRELYAKGWRLIDIAREVGCHYDYVRVAARQRAKGLSKSDIRYASSETYVNEIRPANRARNRARMKAAYDTGDREAALVAGRAAYRQARDSGGSVTQANLAAVCARNAVLYQTSDKAAVSAAGKEAYQDHISMAEG